MPQQPFYHSVSLLFTSTQEVNLQDFQVFLQKLILETPTMKRMGILPSSVVCEFITHEAGDPHDL